ncbi:MAG: YebC/PmpR family DNA-binding transcriptional regulator [Patescibacteria group bacterium]
MSGHSKWHNIQKKKGSADSRRGQLFTKLSKSISICAREGGGDPEFNFALRVAVDAAKAANMTKDKIESAIARGTGGPDAVTLVEVVYEGYGPSGIAFLIRCLTDNKNRAVSEVRNAMNKNEGSLGSVGSVMWMFDCKGVVTVADASVIKDRDAFELAVIDAGAEDIREHDGLIQVVCAIEDLRKVSEAVERLGVKPDGAGIEYVAKDFIEVTAQGVKEKIDKLLDVLDELDDVDEVYTNQL